MTPSEQVAANNAAVACARGCAHVSDSPQTCTRCIAAALRDYGDRRAREATEAAAKIADDGNCGNRGESCLYIAERIRKGTTP